MAGDILHKLGFDATEENKFILHEFHKRVLEYKTISGMEYERLSRFLLDVCVFWAERGIFVRTSGKQEWNLEERPLSEIWDLL